MTTSTEDEHDEDGVIDATCDEEQIQHVLKQTSSDVGQSAAESQGDHLIYCHNS